MSEAPQETKASTGLLAATRTVLPDELQWMVLDKPQLPAELSSFELLHESELDNEELAKHMFGERTAESLRALGRITGYVREFAVPQGAPTLGEEPAEILMAATVVHLFDDEDAVQRWIDDVFVLDLTQHVGQETKDGQMLTGVETLHIGGFFDHSASLLAIHEVPDGVMASTVVDFRVGCLLGVAFVVAKGDVTLDDLAEQLGHTLEQQMVRVVLGAA